MKGEIKPEATSVETAVGTPLDAGSNPAASTIKIHNTVKSQDDLNGVVDNNYLVNVLFNELFALRDIFAGNMMFIGTEHFSNNILRYGGCCFAFHCQ